MAKSHDAERVAEHGEGERHAGERQRHRIAGHQRRDDRDDHEHGEDFGERHQRGPAFAASASRSGKKHGGRPIACATPCSAISRRTAGSAS